MRVVAQQLRTVNPPETKQTYDRLIALGYPKKLVLTMLASVVAAEVFAIIQTKKPFDHARFAAALHRLPGGE